MLTPFERNLQFWRQLWRVVERRWGGREGREREGEGGREGREGRERKGEKERAEY